MHHKLRIESGNTHSSSKSETPGHRVVFIYLNYLCVWERIMGSPNRQEPPHVVTDASLHLPADWQQWHFMVGRHSFWMLCLKLDLPPSPLRCLNMFVDFFFFHVAFDVGHSLLYSLFLESFCGKGWKWYAAHGLLVKGKQSFEMILHLSPS